jgi:hypothetical protein
MPDVLVKLDGNERCPSCGNREFCRADCPAAPWNSDEETLEYLPLVSTFRYLLRKRRWTGMKLRRSEEKTRKRPPPSSKRARVDTAQRHVINLLKKRGYKIVETVDAAYCHFGGIWNPFDPCNLVVVVSNKSRTHEASFSPRFQPSIRVRRTIDLTSKDWTRLDEFEAIYEANKMVLARAPSKIRSRHTDRSDRDETKVDRDSDRTQPKTFDNRQTT